MNGDDWLAVETPDDWLSTDPVATVPAVIEEPGIRVRPVLPETPAAQTDVLQQMWSTLTLSQRAFISTLRACRWNARACYRQFANHPDRIDSDRVGQWKKDSNFATVYDILKKDDSGEVLDTSKLLLRHDDIVEQLLTPTAILHQGAATGYFENRAPAAAKANETLMKAAGLLKGDDASVRHVVRFVNLAGPEVQTAIEVATEIT